MQTFNFVRIEPSATSADHANSYAGSIFAKQDIATEALNSSDGEFRVITTNMLSTVNSTPQAIYAGTGSPSFPIDGSYMISIPSRSDAIKSQSLSAYQELSETLCELRADQEGDWSIEAEVYDTSMQVAATLFDTNVPTPTVFSHGPKSVVFNWDDGVHNLYLTIGKQRLWALASSESGIKGRLELTDPTNNIAGEFLRALRWFSNRPLLTDNSRSEARTVK